VSCLTAKETGLFAENRRFEDLNESIWLKIVDGL
jgi:hypothetical protein